MKHPSTERVIDTALWAADFAYEARKMTGDLLWGCRYSIPWRHQPLHYAAMEATVERLKRLGVSVSRTPATCFDGWTYEVKP